MVVRYRMRLYLLAILFLGGIAALLAKLWSLQIDGFERFRSMVPGTSHVSVRVPGIRGEIKDRNGVTLVTNEPNFEVTFDLRDILKAYRAEHQVPTKVFQYSDRNGVMRESEPEPDVVAVIEDFIIPPLEELGLAVPYNREALQVHYRSSGGVVPWPYRSDLTFEEFAIFAEHNLGIPGVSVTVRAKRRYVFGALASHVLGYVRGPDIKKVPAEEQREWDHYVGDDFGVAGIEKSMDHRLRARPGKRTLLKDEKGVIVEEIGFEEPEKGADIYLTVDVRIQAIAERAMREAGVGRGAVVVMEPSTGDVLAMASVPSFDPNKFIPSIAAADWKAYREDPTRPLVNRALKDFPPGSTFKIPVALAGCYAGVGNVHLNCDGGQKYGSKFMKCWIYSKGGSHGSLSLDDAIMRSCNDYFYQYGNIAGIRSIKTVGSLLGLGEKSGIPLDGEDPGRLPDPAWLRLHRGTGWTDALTALVAIGQGDNEATPLQMAGVASTVAMSGVRNPPWLISKVVEKDGTTAMPARPAPVELVREGLAANQIELVRQGMHKVINAPGGTARRARSEGFETAGKTGTAQDWRTDPETHARVDDNRAWFICFAPFDAPRFAICVMVGNGKSGGGVAAPIAARILEEAVALDQGFEVGTYAMAEAVGSFDHLEAVSFEEHSAAELLGEDEGETGYEAGDAARPSRPESESTSPAPQAPSVRPEVDGGPSPAVPRAVPVRPSQVRYRQAERAASNP